MARTNPHTDNAAKKILQRKDDGRQEALGLNIAQ
jgi:hypothetical protein